MLNWLEAMLGGRWSRLRGAGRHQTPKRSPDLLEQLAAAIACGDAEQGAPAPLDQDDDTCGWAASAFAPLPAGPSRGLGLTNAAALIAATLQSPIEPPAPVRRSGTAAAQPPDDPASEWILGEIRARRSRVQDPARPCPPGPDLVKCLSGATSAPAPIRAEPDGEEQEEAIYRDAVQRFPDSPTPHLFLAEVYWKRSDHSAAVQAARHAVSVAPGCAAAHHNLAGLLAHCDDYVGAVAASREAVALEPRCADYHAKLAGICCGHAACGAPSMWREAVAAYNAAINLGRRDAYVVYGLLLALAHGGDAPSVAIAVGMVADLGPADAGVAEVAASALRDAGYLTEAIACYEAAARADPQDFRANVGLARAFIELRQREEAVRSLSKALEIKPGHSGATWLLADALTSLGRLDEAESACRAAIELMPDRAPAHLALAEVHRAAGRYTEAVREAEYAVSRDPRESFCHFTLGNALYAAGDASAAIRAYARAIELRPAYWRAWVSMGAALYARGRRAEARAIWVSLGDCPDPEVARHARSYLDHHL